MATFLRPHHRNRPCLAPRTPRSYKLCWALEGGFGSCLSMSDQGLGCCQSRVAQPPRAEGQQAARNSVSFNKPMVGTSQPLTSHSMSLSSNEGAW